ncbi:MAG: phosphonate ABC transporter substrate-binding protein [Mesorhizobium sp.]|nr:MAG: phosphonate ABC transporter substrate-binding protein [Mesorhizobium sp.]
MGAKSTASQALRTCAAALAVLSAAPPAHADWRADIGTFRIGIVAEPGGGNTVPGLARLTDAYTNALGMKVEFVVARDYAALIEAQASGRLQYAVYSALAYATASVRCGCVEPLVAPVDADGAAGVRSLLVTRDGKVPGLTAIASHRIDTGGTILRLAAAGVPKTSLRVLWSSAPLRYGPHAVRSDLDAEAKRRLAVFLTNLKSLTPDVYDLLEPTHSGGFELAVSKDYATALAIVRRGTRGD